MTDLIQIFQPFLEFFGATFIIIGGFTTIYIKFLRPITKSIDQSEIINRQLSNQIANMTKTNEELARAVLELTVKISEREKDIVRLEGAVDVTQRNLLETIGIVREASGSLDAMWRTLQRLFPSEVPKRASDKG